MVESILLRPFEKSLPCILLTRNPDSKMRRNRTVITELKMGWRSLVTIHPCTVVASLSLQHLPVPSPKNVSARLQQLTE